MFSRIIRGQENDLVSATKAIIETHIVEKLYHDYFEMIIKKTISFLAARRASMS